MEVTCHNNLCTEIWSRLFPFPRISQRLVVTWPSLTAAASSEFPRDTHHRVRVRTVRASTRDIILLKRLFSGLWSTMLSFVHYKGTPHLNYSTIQRTPINIAMAHVSRRANLFRQFLFWAATGPTSLVETENWFPQSWVHWLDHKDQKIARP